MFRFLLPVFLVILFSACSTPKLTPIEVTPYERNISFIQDVKPVFDKRCVSCHSCYNSPCQAKLSSFEGVARGGSKIEVYNATRLKAIDPTRLFIDASSTQEWREKGFFSLIDSNDTNPTTHNSIMMHLLYDKKQHPQIVGDYSPEHDTLLCPKDGDELAKYFDTKPYHGMPYGLPPLGDKEYNILQSWLFGGAKPPDAKEEKTLKTPSPAAQKQIEVWEHFFNTQDAKHQMTARYLYEHLYLAHIYFPSAKGEFYELVRSMTPSGEAIKIIPTLRPFDNPGSAKFYYRLRKIHTTIVHKTHMTFAFDDASLARFRELFIKPKWRETPHNVSYDASLSDNPFDVFWQIPVRSRYQFLLDNARYIVMTFIRGPVCRGQMALNVIHDHFWVMFQDPNYDINVLHPELLDMQSENLQLPINSVNENLLTTFSDRYRKKYEAYYKAKIAMLSREFPDGLGYDAIWRGNVGDDAPLLTVYRHFDSASVHKGVLGELPRTMWVIDYAQFERLYYTLVAGYDVFGNVSHQTNIRRYMDFLRIEGECNFLNYMPQSQRVSLLQSWYRNDTSMDARQYAHLQEMADGIVYATKNPKREFIEHIVQKHIAKKSAIAFDTINYKLQKHTAITMPKSYTSIHDFMVAAKAVSVAGSGFISYMTDSGANNIFLRIDMPDGSYIRKSLVINRWHDNVNSLFLESRNLDPKKDTMDVLDGSIGSYPNVFAIVTLHDLPDFLDLMKNCSGTPYDIKRMKKYFISRSNPDFWKYYDWFVEDFYKHNPIEAGLYDLNRYARTPWNKGE